MTWRHPIKEEIEPDSEFIAEIFIQPCIAGFIDTRGFFIIPKIVPDDCVIFELFWIESLGNSFCQSCRTSTSSNEIYIEDMKL